MGFDAERAVDGLSYRDGDTYYEIPEPSYQQVVGYDLARQELRQRSEGRREDGRSDSQEEIDADRQLIAEALSDLCGGKPSTAELLALPVRVLAAFRRYLETELLVPTPATAGTRPSLAVVKGDG